MHQPCSISQSLHWGTIFTQCPGTGGAALLLLIPLHNGIALSPGAGGVMQCSLPWDKTQCSLPQLALG